MNTTIPMEIKDMPNATVCKPGPHLEQLKTPSTTSPKKKYLTLKEVTQLVEGARAVKRPGQVRALQGERNAFMIAFAFRHALRISELCEVKWSDLDLEEQHYLVNRAKGSKCTMHWLEDDEIYELKEIARKRANAMGKRTGASVIASDEYVFLSERSYKFTTRGMYELINLAGKAAGFRFNVHPHMLRHAKGYQLCNLGVDIRLIADYMGHRNIKNTMIYTDVDANRMKGLGKDVQLKLV